MRSFGSDNHSGVHPKVMEALAAANSDHCIAYGEDPWTERATASFKREFGDDSEAIFVFGGTGANVVGLSSMVRGYHGIFCSSISHVWMHECGAVETITGARLIAIDSPDGKLTVQMLEPHLAAVGNQHQVQPGAIAITQCNEVGLLYTPDETRKLADFAHSNGMLLHMDGSRIANAAASLGVGLRECTRDVGVDVLSFGGTKNGLMAAEAVVFFREDINRENLYLRKRAAQLPSKLRFVSAQLEALMTDGLWRDNASASNRMAALFAERVQSLPGITLEFPVQTNMVFARLSESLLESLSRRSIFYVRDPATNLVRWVTSFDTTEEDVDHFVDMVKESCGD